MDTFLRVAALLVVGAALLVCNVWYVRAWLALVRPNEYVIAPIKLIGQEDKDGTVGAALAQMLQSRVKSIERTLAKAQLELSQPPPKQIVGQTTAAPAVMSLLPLVNSEGIKVPMGVLDLANINVTVGGVQVGGVIPWIQNLLARQRTLRFTIYGADKDARRIVAGDVQPLAGARDGTIWFETQKPQDEAISDLAYALIQKHLATDAGGRIEVLTPDEFRSLAETLEQAARLNRKIALGTFVGPEEFGVLFRKLQPVAIRSAGWPEINYFAAELGERAGENTPAAEFYKAFKEAGQRPDASARVKQLLKEGDVEARIARLSSTPSGAEALPEDIQRYGVKLAPPSPSIDAARQKIEAEVEYACSHYDQVFHLKGPRARPKLFLITPESNMSFYFNNQIFTPALAADIPDLVYREAAHAYLTDAGLANIVSPEAYAIESSYGDVLPYWLKQKKLKGALPESKWVLYEGIIAWFTGGDPKTDRRPFRSLKSPGSAYKNAATLGDDPQMQYYKRGGIRDGNAASGIANKAFYEVATRLNIDRALQIWIAALPALSKKVTFRALADATSQSARQLFGPGAEAKVREAWQVVGL